MSLERTALRLATVMLLSNGNADPLPTMALDRVFDSRIDSLQFTEEEEVLALITVSTDDDNGAALSQNNGGPPFERAVTLTLDLHLGMPSKETGDVLHMGTEADLERRLDLFEFQVERLLTLRPGVWGEHFNAIARRITDWMSVRYVERDGNVRIAARQIQMTVLLPLADCDGFVVTTDDDAPPAPDVPAPLGPLLDAIIESNSPYATDAETIRDEYQTTLAGSAAAIPPLRTVRIIENERDSQNRPTTRRPDGVAQAELET